VKAGDLDEALSNSVEYSYYFRLSRLGRFAVVDRPLLWYRYSAGQLSSAVFSVSMQTSILKVIEDLPRSDPDVVDGAAARYKERLAFCYLNAAGALAEKDRLRALSYVAKCLWLGRWERRTLRIVARALTPTAAIDLYRRWMRETDAP
jgi:hypothetical protein